MVLLMSIRDHASDVHFEPFEDEYKMRYRCDGVLYEMVPPPRHLATAIASRIKVMANLDIAERRLPQDGRIELNVGGNPVDMRVSVLPTLFGESVVIRVLDRTNVGLNLDKIGMPADNLAVFRAIIKKPNGIVLVTGPTGAGKTTTLYSALSELNDIDSKIITTEDPVEYEIDGIVQCPINHEIDLTFAAASAVHPPPGPGHDPGRRDSRPGNGPDRHPGVAHRATWCSRPCTPTMPPAPSPASATWASNRSSSPPRSKPSRRSGLFAASASICRAGYDPTREQFMEINLTQDR